MRASARAKAFLSQKHFDGLFSRRSYWRAVQDSGKSIEGGASEGALTFKEIMQSNSGVEPNGVDSSYRIVGED